MARGGNGTGGIAATLAVQYTTAHPGSIRRKTAADREALGKQTTEQAHKGVIDIAQLEVTQHLQKQPVDLAP